MIGLLRAGTLALSIVALAGTQRIAHARDPASGLLQVSASATTEIARDVLTVVLAATRSGAEPAAVQTALKQALDAALAQARAAAHPGQLDVQTGQFTLHPQYDPKGGINGWQGTAELIVEGRDLGAIGALAGRVQTMSVVRVAQSLSRERREKAEADLAAQAIARWREKAADYARQFGYARYEIHDVSVSTTDPPRLMPIEAMRANVASVPEMPLPVEAGNESVAVTVSGSVQMLR